MTEAESNQAYIEGLSRLDRTLDDSGYAFTALNAASKNLTNLDSIKSYQHLQFVDVSSNQITDASPLSELPYLLCANLSGNALTTPPVFSNEHLQSVDISKNQINTIQGFQSSSMSSLKINENQLETLNGIGGLPSLLILEASRNNLQDLNSLSNESSKIERLELSENKLTSLNGIEAIANLSSLVVSKNNLETLESLAKLSALEKLSDLDLSENPVNGIDNYRLSLIILIPNLRKLDGTPVTEEERQAAVELKQQREEAAATETEVAE